jgi:hypothetical protein
MRRRGTPNPSLLRSIFTTWLYGIQYDTEDAFLQQIKASSARWKAHSEQIAATVYNRELIYQHQEFAVLLRFCELYSSRFSHDGDTKAILSADQDSTTEADEVLKPTRSGRKRRTTSSSTRTTELTARAPKRGTSAPAYVVEELMGVRVSKQGVKQVQVRWEGYLRCTWEPYESIRQQLPDVLATLESSLAPAEADEVRCFVVGYIATHHIDATYRWVPDRVVALEHAAITHDPPIKLTIDRLQKRIMELVDSTSE